MSTVSQRRPALAGLVLGILLLVGPLVWWLAGSGDTGPAGAGIAPASQSRPAGGSGAVGPGPDRGARPTGPAAPVRVRIPELGVDAPVGPVGVDGRGEMAVPTDVRTVGWYRFGPAPGAAAGSSVLAGHVDDRVQGRGAFYRLAELGPGAAVLVQAADGVELRFRVRAVDRIDKSRLPVERLFARDGAPRLTLITCGGEFDRAAGSFRDNVVVDAIAEP